MLSGLITISIMKSFRFFLKEYEFFYNNLFRLFYKVFLLIHIVAAYDTISTFHGKALLCGGWWGLVRHPNYLGDMIMIWSVAATCGLAHWLPYVFPIIHTAILVHRTFRVSTRCKSVYGASWDRYTQAVQYRLVPGVI